VRRRFALALTVLALAVPACSSSFGMPAGADRQGRAIHDLWQLFFVASVIVAAIVYGLLGFALLRYRARERTDVVRSPREHPVLEITYTVIPIAIVAVLWFASWRTNQDVTALDRSTATTVDVQAYSWGWRFTYPDLGVTVVSQPGGASVRRRRSGSRPPT
jgi:cytochrome c oxidase subunit II